jgi:hypothetical protein
MLSTKSPNNSLCGIRPPREEFIDEVDYGSYEIWDSPSVFKFDKEYREILECVSAAKLEAKLEKLETMKSGKMKSEMA